MTITPCTHPHDRRTLEKNNHQFTKKTVKSGVNPIVKPTVPNAEITSKKQYTQSRFFKGNVSVNERITEAVTHKKSCQEEQSKRLEHYSLRNCAFMEFHSLFPFKKIARNCKNSTPNVVVFKAAAG